MGDPTAPPQLDMKLGVFAARSVFSLFFLPLSGVCATFGLMQIAPSQKKRENKPGGSCIWTMN